MSAQSSGLVPFHLAIPVDDIAAAREFYGKVLGFSEGRSDTKWIDWNFRGHQVVTHQVGDSPSKTPRDGIAGTNPVDGHQVPVPHFGLVLPVPEFQELAERLTAVGTDFVIEPYVRFEGEPGEQWTMFFLDPAGNALEFKAFADLGQLFAV
ncbi:VOC family protein [Streptomyces hygroscopicus]|uniref:VOC family protein n=1 Tax=Streptomyces hygroscopicus TaxID=1912 RepID=UPI00082B3823|nr:VOC family protein [Streptomyces hygroscopicus]GLV79010.1 glyoxalase [Streptomyces hygroscopicus subsp. hygroscopicus]